MLKKIRLRNYRSCIDTTVSLQHDLSVLIGPNGSGKTNLLSGLVLLRRLALHDSTFRSPSRQQATGECALKAWFQIEGKTAIFTANVALYTDERNNDAIVESRQSWYVKDFTGSAKRLKLPIGVMRGDSPRRASRGHYVAVDADGHAVIRSIPGFGDAKTKSALDAIQAIAGWVAGITYYSASQFTNPSACPVSIEVESTGAGRRSRDAGTASRFLRDIYEAHRRADDTYESFKDIIGPRGIRLIDELAFKELKTSSVDYTVRVGGQTQERRLEKMLVVPQFRIGRNTLSPNQLSEGTFKTIALLFYLITRTRTLLLLEEPEVCVHHGLLASILDLMVAESSTQQIVVSTHSDFVLDRVLPRSVYVVNRSEDGETSVVNLAASMTSRERLALRKYLETEGTLGEYWKHGAIE